ncbi:hypothetical protein PsorP6_012069 [Peronosclerospora sorghi]|uniref:Uncharacterized protein n=1 Tax=Peronosclerospora sorghi TaxID=230839 RepID=A0ACC0WK90_9STRA|nr:hypothetical protein PsorP6_012069 [Peronosclerospora sorghi]
MDRSGAERRSDSGAHEWTSSIAPIPTQSPRECPFPLDEMRDETVATMPRELELLLAPRSFSSSENDDVDEQSNDSRGIGVEEDDEMKSIEEEEDEDDEEDGERHAAAAARDMEWQENAQVTPCDVSIVSLRLMAQERGLDTTALSQWSVSHDGKVMDPAQHTYRSVRDAVRAYTHFMRGAMPREDMYDLAVLRRKVAQLDLPLVDGPIRVLALGTIVPEEHFYTSKKLFPIGYESLVNVQLTKPVTIAFRLRCKIVHGNQKKAPIFVVELENSTVVDIVFRSYVARKAWRKAFMHFESLVPEELVLVVKDSIVAVSVDEMGQPLDVLTSTSGEDGFGLLRRKITRVLEGLPQVLLCLEYQFSEERHPVTPDIHSKVRARLKSQLKKGLEIRSHWSKEEMTPQVAQETALLAEQSCGSDDIERIQEQKEKDERDADKRSVREVARKLLEIEIKAQEDAKEVQRQAKEVRKSAILEAKLQVARQKEARKESLRVAKEEEKRMREEEKELKRVLREKEKRKKLEEKETSMKRKIEELRQRRLMREEQKAILENGVVTSSSPRRFSESRKRKAALDSQSLRQQQLVLLQFVEEERDRRRQIRLWEKQSQVESDVWARVKAQYTESLPTRELLMEHELPKLHDVQDATFPAHVISDAVELESIPTEAHSDLLFTWDFLSTFTDCLKLTTRPSLSVFANLMTLSDGSSPVGDGDVDDDSMGLVFSSLHALLVKVLISEYFPLLQLGITLDEFHRTRPMNVFSWPELARQVCQVAMELKHPSVDDHMLKAIKGSKSYRDDSVTQPLRQKLYRRGKKLLQGLAFEDTRDEGETEHEPSRVTVASDAKPVAARASEYYGVVLVDGVLSRMKVGAKDQHLVVTELVGISDASLVKTNVTERLDENVDRMQVGDYLVCINGHDVRTASVEDWNELCTTLQTPHGLLLSSIAPGAKNATKHIATTQGSTKLKCCGFVLKLLRAKEIASPFNQPVDAELYPDYYASGDITEPMDLGTIAEKIEDDEYEHDDVDAFVDDVQLVWRNCYTYNSMKAEISHLAQKLAVIFERLMKEWVYTTVDLPMIAAEEDHCRKCRTIYAKDRLLLCDRCDAPYHTFCLNPALPAIPNGEWFCPVCLADASFSPQQFTKNRASSKKHVRHREREKLDLTELEKRLLCAIDLLSQENYASLSVTDRIKVLRVLCELIEETSVVQAVYHSLQEKANDVRKQLGDPLADIEREWDRFTPPFSSHGIEPTKTFLIDGVEQVLTDELLTYLEKKAKAELESQPLPVLPPRTSMNGDGESEQVNKGMDRNVDEQEEDNSDADENLVIEAFGDRFLDVAARSRPVCAFCGLEDGILNGPLHDCKQSPLTRETTLLHQYKVPEVVASEGSKVLSVRMCTTNDLARLRFEESAEGVQCFEREHTPTGVDSALGIIYAINDRVVCGLSRAMIQEHVESTPTPFLIYLTSLPGEAVRASVSIVKCFSLPLGLTLEVFDSYVFVQSYKSSVDVPVGFAELSGQIFPGDVVWAVNEVTLRYKSEAEADELLRRTNASDSFYAVFVRPPSAKMKEGLDAWQRMVYDVATQRAIENALRLDLIPSLSPGSTTYDVTFQDGPLGLALALEKRGVVVTSLNDHPDGKQGQASLSGQIRRGDLVEMVNGASYGPLSDLSQFTSWLLSLPRPLRLTFSRQGGAMAGLTPEDTSKRLVAVLETPSSLYKALKLPMSSLVKTYHIASLPLPFEAVQLLESLAVIATTGIVSCDKEEKNSSGRRVEIGDRIVGLNGQSIAGLSWATVQTLCAELAVSGAAYLHLTPFLRPTTLCQAHERCVESANVAWSECGVLFPRVQQARALETFLRWSIVPRTLAFGRCRYGFVYYRFVSDLERLFVLSRDHKWSVCATREQLVQLISYLEVHTLDAKIAAAIRRCFHGIVESEPLGTESVHGFVEDGPFAVAKEMVSVMDGDVEKIEALVKSRGRNYILGSFETQQEADAALERAELLIKKTGCPLLVANEMAVMQNTFPSSSLIASSPKANHVIQRVLMQKYELGNCMDGHGPTSMSQDVYQTMKRGLQSTRAMLSKTLEATSAGVYATGWPCVPLPKLDGDVHSSTFVAAQARYNEALKRKQSQRDGCYVSPRVDHVKRPRYVDSNAAARIQTSAGAFKRSLQTLVDQGRSMLTAWNRFAAAATVETTHALACACLSSFEEVKQVISRVVVHPQTSRPDPPTFVCLHHAFVMGLICAMATQALTTSRKTRADAALVKHLADAFATAILSCVDPSSLLRARALGCFATAAQQCAPSHRSHELSSAVHNVANFLLLFLRTTQYLGGAAFEDVSTCRPLFQASTQGVEALPASFVQQLQLLETIRLAYLRTTRKLQPLSPSTIQAGASADPSYALVDVQFGHGPLGVVINYSKHGTILVTEFTNDKNRMGQAQASGNVFVGDEVVAVNGKTLQAIGMEGFKTAVATSPRPLTVTFRRKRQPHTAGALNMGSSSPSEAQGMTGSRGPLTLNQQAQGTNECTRQGSSNRAGNSKLVSMDDTGLSGTATYDPAAVPAEFFGMSEPTMSLFPFPSAPSSQQMSDHYGGLASSGPSTEANVSGHAFSTTAIGAPTFEMLSNVYGSGETSAPMVETTTGDWPDVPESMIAQLFPSGAAPTMNETLPVDPIPLVSSTSQSTSETSTGTFEAFVAGNDVPVETSDGFDPSQVTYYDANETTYRGAQDFEIDPNRGKETTPHDMVHVQTEPDSPSLSQVTTPAQSDTDAERSSLQAASHALDHDAASLADGRHVAECGAPAAANPAIKPPRARIGDKKLETSGMWRRSSRVSRKSSNIADMYDPERAQSSHGKGGTASSHESGIEEPTDGDVGELATELLEAFRTTIRPRKQDVPRSLRLLGAQLLMMEAAIPRDAFRLGRWGRSIRAAWAEMVYTCDTAAILMEAVVFLEVTVDPEWLDPCWKASPLPSAKNAITTATIASVAMRLYSLDEAISYGRVKRASKRKHRTISRMSARQTQKSVIRCVNSTSAANGTTRSELPLFVSTLSPGVVALATKMIQKILEAQRERSWTTLRYRKARSEVAAIASLTEEQVEQWIQASLAQIAAAAEPSQSGRPGPPKRKQPSSHSSKTAGGARACSSRKRRAPTSATVSRSVAPPHDPEVVELRCYQMKTLEHCFPLGSAQDRTLRSRFEYILDLILGHELAGAFAAPVQGVPGYAAVIKHPMDLGTIKLRLCRGYYDQRFEQLVRDVNLVWDNCSTFNRRDAEIAKSATRLQSIFNRLFEQWITNVPLHTPVTHLASEELCRHCGQMHAQESMLLCDSCDAAYHAFCLAPRLPAIPPGNWYCPRCPVKRFTA